METSENFLNRVTRQYTELTVEETKIYASLVVKEKLEEVVKEIQELKNENHESYIKASDNREKEQYAAIGLGISLTGEIIKSKM
jgi:hypothetical protein